jgi:hypothetical protein
MGEFSCCSYRRLMLFADIVSVIGAEHRGARRRNQSLAQLERDAALSRLSRTRRWVIAGAAALTAGFAALVSALAPGRTLGARAEAWTLSSTPATPARSVARMPPLASPSALGLQGPSQAPQADSSQQAAPAPAQQSTPDPSQPAASAPAPTVVQSSGGGGAVVSGGS